MIDGRVNQEVIEVDNIIAMCNEMNQNNNCNVAGTFKTRNEGSSFLSKESMKQYVPHVMKLLKMCVRIDRGI